MIKVTLSSFLLIDVIIIEQKCIAYLVLINTYNVYDLCLTNCTLVPAREILVLFVHAQQTHLSQASFLWDIGKQCSTRSDAAERCLIRLSTIFLQRFYSNLN